MLLVTRLGRKTLMDGDCVSNVYTVLQCGVWCAAAAAGAYVCCAMSPLPPYGTIAFPIGLAVISGCVVLHTNRQLPDQQSTSALAGIFAMLAVGTFGGLYLRHAFAF